MEVALKEHAYNLTLAMVPFWNTHGGFSGSWVILRDNIFPGTGGAGLRGVAEGVVRAVGRWAGGRWAGGVQVGGRWAGGRGGGGRVAGGWCAVGGRFLDEA